MKSACWLIFISGGLFIGCREDRNERLRLEFINKSLMASNNQVAASMDKIYLELEEKDRDPRYHNAAIWWPLADTVRRMTLDQIGVVDSLIAEMNRRSDSGRGDQDRDMVRQVMDKEGKGRVLFDTLLSYRKAIFGLFIPEKLVDYPESRVRLKKELKEIEVAVPLNFSLFEGTSKKDAEQITDWMDVYFGDATGSEAMAVLNKIKNDLFCTGSVIVRYCAVHVWAGDSYDRFAPLTGQNSKYLKKGDTLEVTAGVGWLNFAGSPKFTIKGIEMPLGKDGLAIYKMRANGSVGKHVLPLKVEFYLPDGTRSVFDKPIEYIITK